jgi:hypothetical protein
MTRIEELDKQEKWDMWYYERLQQSVNKVISSIPEERDSSE